MNHMKPTWTEVETSTEDTKMPHTPGPWRVDYDSTASPNIWIAAANDPGIAKIETADYDDGLGHRLTETDWANARLIAAAPTLLTVLKDMRQGYVNLIEIVLTLPGSPTHEEAITTDKTRCIECPRKCLCMYEGEGWCPQHGLITD